MARYFGNSRLEPMEASTRDELDRVLYLPQLANVWDRIDSSFAEPQRISEAIRQRDAAAARAVHDHVLLNPHFVIDGLISSPHLQSINLVSF
jgi:DNA-binding FadR family transcriptional regulator